jgi:hypothetical protein
MYTEFIIFVNDGHENENSILALRLIRSWPENGKAGTKKKGTVAFS